MDLVLEALSLAHQKRVLLPQQGNLLVEIGLPTQQILFGPLELNLELVVLLHILSVELEVLLAQRLPQIITLLLRSIVVTLSTYQLLIGVLFGHLQLDFVPLQPLNDFIEFGAFHILIISSALHLGLQGLVLELQTSGLENVLLHSLATQSLCSLLIDSKTQRIEEFG